MKFGALLTLSIVILSWNTKDLTRNCLRSIFDNCGAITAERSERLDNVKDFVLASEASKEDGRLPFEVIVVENGSADGSPEMIEQEFPQVKLIKNSENLGFTKGNNQGFKASRGEYILFLNSDTIVPPPGQNCHVELGSASQKILKQVQDDETKSQLRKMVDKMKEDRSIGMLTPKLIYPDGKFQDEYYRKLPSIIQTFWVYLFPFNKLTHNIKFLRRRYLSDANPDKSGYIENYNVPGAAPIMSREAHGKIGGRDENIFYWMEDVDLCWSLKKAGYKLYYLAEATIIHLGGQSNIMWDDLRKMLDFRKGYVYVFRKHKGKFQGFIVKWMFILNALIAAPFLLVLGIFKRKFWKKGIAAVKFSWKFLKA